MVAEHRALHPAIDAVDLGMSTGVELRSAVRALDKVLGRHLEHEELVIFPLLGHHLSRREWRAFLITERRRTPLRHRPQFLTWVLDEASDADADAVLAELPRPGRLAYRKVLRPHYGAKRRWDADQPVMSHSS
jgi:hypothetical protein